MMEKYCFSFRRSLFFMLLALSLLLLLQSPYSGGSDSGKLGFGSRSINRPAGKVLPEQEVAALNDIIREQKLQPAPTFTAGSCFDKSTRIWCNCDPRPLCRVQRSNIIQGSSAADDKQRPGIDCDLPPPPGCRQTPVAVGYDDEILAAAGDRGDPGSAYSRGGGRGGGFNKRNRHDCLPGSKSPNYTIPFCHVKYILLSGQQLYGVIPSSLANLTYLERLDLSNNYLTGEIPGALGSLKRLNALVLSNNFLIGEIPGALGSLKRLNALHLYRNFLNGPIPKELGALTSLSYLDLWANSLTGEIPEELGNLVNLTYLDLSSNQLTGKLPAKLGQLKLLQILYMSDNAVTGALPKELSELKNLQQFNAMGNSFSGPIPEEIGNWKGLTQLQLQGNNFEGPLPKAIFRLENLSYLMISDLNDTTGQGLSFPDITKLKYLETLILRNCSIKGKIPEYIGKMASLRSIDLSFNSLDGELPKEINQLKLDYLFLTGNKLTGSIPSWGSNWTQMHVDFSHNTFTKVNFKYFKNMSSHLNLYACCSPTTPNLDFEWEKTNFSCSNGKPKSTLFINSGGMKAHSINDSDYEEDLNIGGASTIYLSKHNEWAYSSTGDFIGGGGPRDYLQNRTCGINMADAPLYANARLSPMSLKYYGHCLNNANYTVKLYFAEIVFTDKEDDSIKGKRVFDVFIQGKNVLKDFNIKKEARGPKKEVTRSFPAVVTRNVLEIHFYWAGKGSVYIPPGLYGPLISAVSVTPVPRAPGTKPKLSAVKIVGIAGSAVFLIILLSVFLWRMWLGKKGLHDEDLKALVLFPGGAFNFQQIKSATRNFHSDNKIGEGGFGPVYKGVLPNKMTIAVKQLSSKSKQGTREFINEVGTVSALKHTNLVRLLGCCTENNQLLLVYEYMENNSLSSALFGPGSIKSRLNWSTRFNICLGIAKGLAFLHEESKLKIIHRDIKPTNVLLDKDLNAKISDFGLARNNEGEHTHIITKVAGTSGYMAPEYAMRGHLTSKADVYSFGVVMLEIVSGKNSTDYRPNDETVFLLDLAYVLQQKGNLLDLTDPELKMDYSVKEATRVLELAMCCTNPSPTLRPLMSEVVSILEGKTEMKKSTLPAPYSVDEFQRAKLIADLSLSTHSGSTSGEKSSSFFSSGTSMEEKRDRPVQNPLHDISDENAGELKKQI